MIVTKPFDEILDFPLMDSLFDDFFDNVELCLLVILIILTVITIVIFLIVSFFHKSFPGLTVRDN